VPTSVSLTASSRKAVGKMSDKNRFSNLRIMLEIKHLEVETNEWRRIE